MRFTWLISAACLAGPAMASEVGSSSVFSFDLAEDELIRTTRDLPSHVPNLVGGISPYAASQNALTLRGLGTAEVLPTQAPLLAVRVDGVQLPAGVANHFAFFDLDEVTAYRGAQPIEIGRNSMAGAVDVRWKKIGDKINGFYEAGIGDHSLGLLRGSLQLPVTEGVAVAVSGYLMNSKGYVRNVSTGDRINDDDMSGLRFALQLTPLSNLDWTFAFTRTLASGEAAPGFQCNPVDASQCDGRYASTGLPRKRGEGTFYDVNLAGAKAENRQGNTVSTNLFTSTIDWKGDIHRLQVITGVVDVDGRTTVDHADGRPLPTAGHPDPAPFGYRNGGLTTLTRDEVRQYSQEIRFSGGLGVIGYLAGFSWQDGESNIDMANIRTVDDGSPLGVPEVQADRILRVKDKALSGFGQLWVSPTSWMRALAAVRYTDEKRSLAVYDHLTGNNHYLAAIGSKLWTPEFALQFLPGRTLNVQLTASKGSRSGGWNGRAPDVNDLSGFGAETGWTYEAGVSGDFLDGRLQVNLAGFYTDIEDSQVSLANGRIVNGTGWRNKGVELEVGASPAKGVLVYAQVGTQDAEYRAGAEVLAQQAACQTQLANSVPADSCGVGIVTADGDLARPVRAPKLSLALGGHWDIPLPASGVIVTPSVHAVHRSAYETDSANISWLGAASPGSRTEAHWMVKAGVAMETDDKFWRLALECQNCLNETVSEGSLYGLSYLNLERRWLLAARRRF